MARLLRVAIFVFCFMLVPLHVAYADLVQVIGNARMDIESRIEPNVLSVLRKIGGPDRSAAPCPRGHAQPAFHARGPALCGGH